MAERRLAVLCSHLRPTDLGRPLPLHRRPGSSEPPAVSASCCRGSRGEAGGEEGIAKKRCVFCEIIRGESPAFKLYEDDVCLCILDSNPLSYGHSLIIPKSHFPSLEATPPPVIAAMCSKIPFLGNAIMKATQCDSFNLLVNNGLAAGQVIFHTHFHIIPRKAGDHLWSSESCRRQPLQWNQETVNLVNCIQERLSPVSSDSCRTLGLMLPRCVQED